MPKVTAKVVKKDGGYFFPELDIHVVANNEKEAKELVKEYHGIDVDEQVAFQQEIAAQQKANAKKK